jgi:hypothetical protein
LLFVYLPAAERYLTDAARLPRELLARDEVLRMLASGGVPVVDVTTAFSGDPDPLRFFVARAPLHYTAEGYHLAAESVLEALEPLAPGPALAASKD